MFVTVDGEVLARKVFRRAQSNIKSEGRERKKKEFLTLVIVSILRRKLT